MEENLDIRQNKDLIQSLNEIYQMNISLQKELEYLRATQEEQNQLQTDKILQINKLIMESNNSINSRVRNYQKDQVNMTRSLNNLDELCNEVNVLKNENRLLKTRLKNLSNDMIDLQSHIIYQNPIEKSSEYPIESSIEYSSEKSKYRSISPALTDKSRYIQVDRIQNESPPLPDFLNPVTKI